MPEINHAVAVSHVGKVRANNQDSGYAGRELFLVADGMGGHAGGDVASALALRRIKEADRQYADAAEAEDALHAALLAANTSLTDKVMERPELTGMGTTVSAICRVGDHMAVAHIGDSRIYLFRDGVLTQVSTDHTFVQRLVDSGRITREEARVHPRRSVLMRVLGDVDASPEIDTFSVATRPGDRWLLCSDGLTGVLHDAAIRRELATGDSPRQTASRLLRHTLDGGAPDNVTIVILDIADDLPGTRSSEPVTVGSAAGPLGAEPAAPAGRTIRLPALRLRPASPLADPSHFESPSQDYLNELIEEDARRARRRKTFWLVAAIVVALALVAAGFTAYRWTQSMYYVGVHDGQVVIYRGVQQSVGPLSLSHVYERSGIPVSGLDSFDRQQVTETVNTDSLPDARRIVEHLRDDTDSR
ncbi:MAG TPA: protein phosphatase 2C domain-containing protein [Microbacteriaceae bacterium]|nr:protein phosphatase 2C domain-containing protein [Microbacteriaceae bacterium]